MKKTNKKAIVILGPTSSGKSDIAIALAKKLGGEIISADSRQVYRGMDLGSGKVEGAWDKKQGCFASAGVPHWMIDVVSPKTDFNVSKFQKKALRIMKDISKRGKVPIICGGTGFWIKSVVDNVIFPQVNPDWKLREELSAKTAEVLLEKLKKLDPERASTIDPKNKVRLIRAIEICQSLGSVPKQVERRTSNVEQFSFIQIGLSISDEKLKGRIMARIEKRLEAGMIDEVFHLHHDKNISWKRLESFGLEYYWISLFLRKKISLEEMKEKLFFDTVHYAKRQMTWFKKDSRIVWLKKLSELEKKATNFLK